MARPELPTGTVTFLFTDVEGSGSTRLLQRTAAEAMMAFHRSLIEFARRRALSRTSTAGYASEIRAAGEHALALLEGGLADYARRASPETARDHPGEN